MTSVWQLPGGNGNQFFSHASDPSMEHDWGQNFSGNFPPLPEPSNPGLFVALPTRSGQLTYHNQQQFGSQPGFGGPQQYANQPPYGSQTGLSGSQQLKSQPGFGA